MRWRIALLATAATLVAPSLAHAATVRAVVVAKVPARHALVVGSAKGAVTTLRVSARQLARVPVGARISAAGQVAADGSLDVVKLTRAGTARRAHLRVVVVKVAGSRLLVSGGGSTFAIRLTGRTRRIASATPTLATGDVVETDVEVGDDLVSTTVAEVGLSPVIEFSGIVTSLLPGSLVVASDGIPTTVLIPAGVTLPAIVALGVEVEVTATISGSDLTLATIAVEDAPTTLDAGGVDVSEDGTTSIEGTIVSVAAGTIVIQPGEKAAPVTLAVPPTMTLPTLAAGDRVEAEAASVGGVLTLTKLEVEGGDDGPDGATTSPAPSGGTGTGTGDAGSDDGGTGTTGGTGGDGPDHGGD